MIHYLSALAARLRGLFGNRRADRELDDEIETHLRLLAERYVPQGMTEAEADWAARRQFGNVTLLQEVNREMRGIRSIEALVQDLRYGARMLRKKPGFTLIAVITLALGIGANTAIFSVLNAVLLRALPYPAPERLVVLTEKARGGQRVGVAYPNYLDFRERAQSFTEMAGFRGALFNLTGVDRPARLQGRAVNWNFFRLLGAQPQLGRLFVADDDKAGAPRTTILSYTTWQAQFGGDHAIIGKAISLDGNSYTVIGVAPPRFGFFRRDYLFGPLRVSALAADHYRADHGGLNVLARLKVGVSLSQASAEMDTLTAQLERAYPDTNSGFGALTDRLIDRYTSDIQRTLWVLLGAVGFVLLIACVNIANLLSARAAERQKEIAIRLALGAGRWRIIRQLLSESLLLSLFSGLAGLLLGVWMMEGLAPLAPDDMPRLDQTGLDATVLLFTLGVSLAMGLLFGLLPARQFARRDLHAALKEGGRSTAGAGREGMRKGVLGAEVGLSLMLLVGAGLMLRTFYHLTRVDPGFAAENVLTMRLNLPRAAYDRPRQWKFESECLARIEALPGAQAAALTAALPIEGSNWNSPV